MALDSGASRHFLNSENAFDCIHTDQIDIINVADGRKLNSSGHGPALGFPDASFVPSFPENLLSITRLCEDHDAVITITKHEASVSVDNAVKLIGYPVDGLYRVRVNRDWLNNNYSCANLANAPLHNVEETIHRRLAHQGAHVIKSLLKSEHVTGAKDFLKGIDPKTVQKAFCNACAIGKSTRQSHPSIPANERRPTEKGSLISNDITGPFPRSFHGEKYMDIYIDHHTEFVWVYCCKTKSEKYENFIDLYENHLSLLGVRTILHCDPAGENQSNRLIEYCTGKVRLEFTCVDFPQQNGKVEDSTEQSKKP